MAVDKSAWESHFTTGVRGPYDFTILMAQFTTDARFSNGEVYVLLLTGLDEDEAPVEEMLSLGADWESLDGGVTITHPRKGGINRNTNYGQWCHFVTEACDKAGAEWIYSADPLDARTWVGTIWHMEEKMVGKGFTNRQTKEEVPDRYRLMPDSYLGREGAEGAETVSAPATPAPTPSVASPDPTAASPATNGAVPASDATGLAANLARSSPDFASFITQALSVDLIAHDDSLVPLLLDSSPTGFYASHHS